MYKRQVDDQLAQLRAQLRAERLVRRECLLGVPEGDFALGHAKQAFASDEPLSPELRAQLRELVADLVAHARERTATA